MMGRFVLAGLRINVEIIVSVRFFNFFFFGKSRTFTIISGNDIRRLLNINIRTI